MTAWLTAAYPRFPVDGFLPSGVAAAPPPRAVSTDAMEVEAREWLEAVPLTLTPP